MENFIIQIFKHGNSVCIYIKGRRGTGKTDHSLFISEIVQANNLVKDFATNIKIYKAPYEIDYITNLDDLTDWCNVGTRRKLFILDEAGKSLRRRTPMSKLNIELLDKLQILRKFKLSIIMIAPDEKYIDSASLGSDVLDATIDKPEFNNPKIAIYADLMLRKIEGFSNIPATSIKYDTWDIAPFTLHRQIPKVQFSDPELRVLAQLGQGVKYSDIGLHPQQINRIVRKFCRVYTDGVASRITK